LLDGTLKANGEEKRYAGAGGSVTIDTATLSGSGSIQANGGSSTYWSSYYGVSGGGGRIVTHVDDDSAFDPANYQALGGSYGYNDAGAGTVFRTSPAQQYGHLQVGNSDTAAESSTPITQVGRHFITDVEYLGSDQWKVAIGTETPVHLKATGTLLLGGEGSVHYHNFSLTESATVIVEANAQYDSDLCLLLDDGDLDASDLVVRAENSIERTLPAGDYIVAIGADDMSTAEAVAGINSPYSVSGSGDYILRIDTQGTWLPTDSERNWGLDGFTVDLDADDATSPHYRISSNGDESLIIETADDLSEADLVGKELLGVHTFETLNVTGGAQVDFGDDRVIVNDLTNSTIDSDSSVTADADSVLP
jgi:hypothetical protein